MSMASTEAVHGTAESVNGAEIRQDDVATHTATASHERSIRSLWSWPNLAINDSSWKIKS